MKKIFMLLIAMAGATGLVFVACHRSDSNKSEPVSFQSFRAEILDLDYWATIHTPGVMGVGEEATLVVGRAGYEDSKYYPGDVTWNLAPAGVLVFVSATWKTGISEDKATATGNIVGIRSISEGRATVTATDASGNILSHEFVVGNGQHYRPDGEWQDSSSSAYPESSSSTYPKSSSSVYPQSSSSTYPKSSSSVYPQSSSSTYPRSSSSVYQKSSSASF